MWDVCLNFLYSRSVIKALYVAWWCAVPEINIWIIDFYCILCWKNGVMGISWIQSTMARVTVHCSEFLQTSTWGLPKTGGLVLSISIQICWCSTESTEQWQPCSTDGRGDVYVLESNKSCHHNKHLLSLFKPSVK